MAMDFDALQQTLQYHFKDIDLLETALTHSSAGRDCNYERLEFLGDRVLGLVMAHVLFDKFPDEAEGNLAKRQAALVQGSTLADIAKTIDLGDFLILSDAERAAGGAENIHLLADAMEAIIGAMYLDSDLSACATLIECLWNEKLYIMEAPPQHPKTELQELLQSNALSLPQYEITGQSGPDHAPIFEVTLSVHGFDPVRAEGRSRQMAEKEAAKAFLRDYHDRIAS